jgi:hypothetical protein
MLRMRRSNIVIASETDQSIAPREERMGCFIASLLAMTPEHESAISPQVLREFFQQRFTPEIRGRTGMPGAGAPAASCAHGVTSMHTSIHSEVTGTSRHSRTQWF